MCPVCSHGTEGQPSVPARLLLYVFLGTLHRYACMHAWLMQWPDESLVPGYRAAMEQYLTALMELGPRYEGVGGAAGYRAEWCQLLTGSH
jgi:hypothetical protein